MDKPSTLTTSKQIKLIEAVTFMIHTMGKLRDQGINQEDFPPDLLAVKGILHLVHADLASSLPQSGKDFLMSAAIKVPIANMEQGKQLEKKLFSLGFGYFVGGEVVQRPTSQTNLLGLKVNKRGHISSFLSDEDEMYFETDLSRLVPAESVFRARSYTDL
jgi:hypothetical protein